MPAIQARAVCARFGILATCLAVVFAVASTAGVKRPIRKATVDPTAQEVELFEAIDSGSLDVTVICKDEFQANVFVQNKTERTLTVKLPKAAAAVQVLKQPQFGQLGQQQPQNGQNNGNGQAQSTGGGFQGFGNANNGQQGFQANGFGNGFFSVPPDRTVQVPFTSVCLNHGKGSPRPAMTYKLVPVETYTQDPVLQELLAIIGTSKLDRQAAQAAAWHLTDDMSWDALAAKSVRHLGGLLPTPFFTKQQLDQAKSLVNKAQAKAREKKGSELATNGKPKL